ncbi:MAG: hypothetical protein ACOWWM_01435 [Desulfobacterales bacterium]
MKASFLSGLLRIRWATVVAVACVPEVALAGQPQGGWRGAYDAVMVWVNFGILMALLYKVLKNPIRDFLLNQRNALAAELARLEAEKQTAAREIMAVQESLETRQQDVEALRQKIVNRGEQDREALILEARTRSTLMLDGARRRIEGRLRDAGEELKAEMIDAAVNQALKELPRRIRPEDHQKWVERFIQEVSKSTPPPK